MDNDRGTLTEPQNVRAGKGSQDRVHLPQIWDMPTHEHGLECDTHPDPNYNLFHVTGLVLQAFMDPHTWIPLRITSLGAR